MNARVLVMGHAHPDFSMGGGELAAYQLFKACAELPEVEAAWFVGASGRSASGAIRLRRPNEYLWDQRTSGPERMFMFRAENLHSTLSAFRDLIEELRPTVVYIHHYFCLGLECLRVIRQSLPSAKIVMTLHEMLAICNHDGQMVKARSLALCSNESPDECNRCFPQQSVEAFWLRKRFIMNSFDLIDHFVTPSIFLKDRYVAWGLDSARITVIENGQADTQALPPREIAPGGGRTKFAFFGQINPYKGVDVLLESLKLLSRADRKRISVEIHGANLELQNEQFQKKIADLREPLERDGVIRWVGPYTRSDLPKKMAKIDWLLVPSVWWENSPMVIQEAFALGRPVVCSGIGGMGEKVRHNVDGWHVEPKSPYEWADTFTRLMDDPTIWDRLHAGIRRPLTYRACAEQHFALFD